MKQKTIILAIMMLCASLPSVAQMLLNYSTGRTVSTLRPPMPQRDVEELTNGSIKVTYSFNSALLVPDDVYIGTYWWKFNGFGANDAETEAAVPMRRDAFEIPEGKKASVRLLEYEYSDFSYKLAPARSPLVDSGNETYTAQNVKNITITSDFIPKNNVQADIVENYRGTEIFNVLVCPVKYGSMYGTVRAAKKLSYLVEFSDKISLQNAESENEFKLTIAHDDYFIPNTVGNGMEFTGNTFVRVDKTYLILTTDELKSSISSFVEWKQFQGFNVVVESSESWTYESAKQKVDETFLKYPDLYYLLIVGDINTIPGKKVESSYDKEWKHHYTDRYFSMYNEDVNGLPSISVGRIPYSNASDVSEVMNKITKYEKNPINLSSSTKFVGAAYFEDKDYNGYEDRRFVLTTEEVCDYIESNDLMDTKVIYYAENTVTPLYWNNGSFSNGGSLPENLKRPNFQWSGNASDISSEITSKCSILLHRDHGYPTYWGDPYYSTTHIKALSNRALPMVLSINCLTGRYEVANCFASEFFKTESNRAIGVIAASSLSYSGYNDALTLGMIDAMWPNPGILPTFNRNVSFEKLDKPIYAIGEIMNQGLKRMRETYAFTYGGCRQHTDEIFHVFGDPSMSINTETLINANDITTFKRLDPDTTALGLKTGYLQVDLTQDAYIGFYNKATGESERYYGRSIYKIQHTGDNWVVSVYGPNMMPYWNQVISLDKNPGLEVGPILPINPTITQVSSNSSTCSVMLADTDEDAAQPVLEVRNTYGTVVSRTQCEEGVSDYSIDISGLNSGIYVVSLSLEGNIVDSKHFVK